ncbi:hypothetical protein D3C72_2396300 [compost metagenome]
MLLAVKLQKRIHVTALDATSRDETAPVFTQQLRQAFLIGVFSTQCFDERLGSLFRGWKGLLCRRHA